MTSWESLWENQRHYGLAGWLAPAPFERKPWSDNEGRPVTLSEAERPDVAPNWKPVVTDETDAEGWVYSTSFAHIASQRQGGRACKRATDRVRRREWRHSQGDRLNSMHRTAQSRAHHPVDVQRCPLHHVCALGWRYGSRGLQQFMVFLSEINSRKKIWDYLPWDPIAWLLVHAEHQEYLSSFESLQLRLNDCVTHKSEASIEELLCRLEMGVKISRAAYGYAMAAGHMDSIEDFIAMHTIHSQYFDPVAGASLDANLEAVQHFTGYKKEDIIMSDWSNREFQPCHFLALDFRQKSIVLAIRGSNEMGDFVTDISGAPLTVDIGGVSGKVHEGSMAAAIYVQCKTAPFLKDLFHQYPDWSLFITGHSIGGGVAALLALILKYENALPSTVHRLHCVAVASAAGLCDPHIPLSFRVASVVMSENLAELCKDFVTTLVLRYDVVPRLSAYSIESMMVELVNASPAKKTVDSLVQTATSAIQTLKERFIHLRGAVEKQRPREPVADLRRTREMAADEAAVERALIIVRRSLDGPQRDPSQSTVSSQNSPSPVSPHHTERIFTPLFPPGRVLWLFGTKHEGMEKASGKDAWWESIQNWSRDTLSALHRTASLSNFQQKSVEMTEKVALDMSWLQEWLQENESPQPYLLPCAVLQSVSSCREERGVEEEAGEKLAEAVLIEAERKSFSRLLIHPSMMQDHLPRSYAESVAQLRSHVRHRRTNQHL